MHNILIVKLSSLGDVIQTLPALHDLQQACAGASIDWVVEEAFAPLLGYVRGLRQVIPFAQRRWRHSRFAAPTRAEVAAFRERLRQTAYDAVIDFQGLVKSALVARRARLNSGGHRYSYANGSELCGYEWPVRFLVDRPLPMERRVHAVQRYRLLAARALRYEPHGAACYPLRLAAGGQGRELMFVHGTTRPDNEWPEAHWIELGRRLGAQGFGIALPHAGTGEQARAERIAAAVGAPARVLPVMTLAELAPRMAQCGGVIGIDSGLSHLAVALDLPHVQLFSQPRAWRAGPVGSARQLAVGGEAAPDVATVWQAWQRVWIAARGDEPSPAADAMR